MDATFDDDAVLAVTKVRLFATFRLSLFQPKHNPSHVFQTIQPVQSCSRNPYPVPGWWQAGACVSIHLPTMVVQRLDLPGKFVKVCCGTRFRLLKRDDGGLFVEDRKYGTLGICSP